MVEVTKLLSNLLKFHNIKQIEAEKRIIDSNEKVVERLKDFFARQRVDALGEEEEQGFVGGLFAERVELIETQAEQEAVQRRQEAYDEMIFQAKEQAKKIITEAELEADRIKEEASAAGEQQGYEEGYQKGIEEIQKMKKELEAKERELLQDYHKKVNELEPALVDVVADVFERVFHVQFDDKKSMVLHLAKNAMDKIENSREFIVRVPKENYAFVKERQDELEARVGKAVRVEVIEDMLLKKNQCVIETDSGVFDCSLDIQMECLLKDLRSLSI